MEPLRICWKSVNWPQIYGKQLGEKRKLYIALVCQDCQAKYHRLGGLHNKNLFSHSSGAWKSKIKVCTGLVPLEASPLGLQMATYPLHLPMIFLLCVRTLISSSYKDRSGSGLPERHHISFITSFFLFKEWFLKLNLLGWINHLFPNTAMFWVLEVRTPTEKFEVGA